MGNTDVAHDISSPVVSNPADTLRGARARASMLSTAKNLAPPSMLCHREQSAVVAPVRARVTCLAGDFSMRRFINLAGVAVTLMAFIAGANAQQGKVQVGILECRGGASVGFIVGSVTNLGCVLRTGNLPDDFY